MKQLLSIFLLSFFFLHSFCYAQEAADPSPKEGWSGDFQVVETKHQTVFSKILLWIPNRVMDFVDIFRVDAGVGFSTGAVVRISKYAQLGYRTMNPTSFRIGDFGRTYPWLLESSNEMGASPLFVQSKDRKVCNSEIGVGADVVIVGAYGGICLEEVFDFVAGIFFIDLKDDDL